MPVRRLGAAAEDMVAGLLLQRGWTVVTRRWKGQAGELDLVALDGETLVVVEVKARRQGSSPEEALTPAKAVRIQQTAQEYLHKTGLEPEMMRFDIAMIEGKDIRYTENALDFDRTVAVEDGECDVY